MGRFSISRASVDGGRRGSLGNQEEVAQLAALGHQQELERNFSFVSMLGLAFAILNSWTALAASISLALPSGGPSSVTWGTYKLPHLQAGAVGFGRVTSMVSRYTNRFQSASSL